MNKGYVMDAERYEQIAKGMRGGKKVKRDIVAYILESFYGCGWSIPTISKECKISANIISDYIELGISKKNSETTETITLKSKV